MEGSSGMNVDIDYQAVTSALLGSDHSTTSLSQALSDAWSDVYRAAIQARTFTSSTSRDGRSSLISLASRMRGLGVGAQGAHTAASLSTLAAASAFSRRRSASRTCFPALTRRAIA